MKYAIITINYKHIPEDNINVTRRILIKYQKVVIGKKTDELHYGCRLYKGVKVIKKDPYFTDNELHSFSYLFPDGKDEYIVKCGLAEMTKPYYSIPKKAIKYLIGSRRGSNCEFDRYLPKEFCCNNDDDAILRFEIEK